MVTKITLTFLGLTMVACASSPPPEAASGAPSETANAVTDASAKPEATATKKHLAEHVTYPATRGQILAACAQTPEFTEGEKRWLSENLPEGSYESADQVATALEL